VHDRRGEYCRRTGLQTTKRTERALAATLTLEDKSQRSEHLARDLERIPWPPFPMSWQEACGLDKDLWEGVAVDRSIDAVR